MPIKTMNRKLPHRNEVSSQRGGIETAPAGHHIIALGNWICATIEARLIVVGRQAAIAGRRDVVEIAAVMRPTGNFVQRGIEETQRPLARFGRLFIGERDHGCPHGGRRGGAANRYPTTTGSTTEYTATAAA